VLVLRQPPAAAGAKDQSSKRELLSRGEGLLGPLLRLEGGTGRNSASLTPASLAVLEAAGAELGLLLGGR
jgi:hypothetical protein